MATPTMRTPRGGVFFSAAARPGGTVRSSRHSEHSGASVVLPALNPKSQPRIPTYGPASQLSPEVLISGIAPHGLHLTSLESALLKSAGSTALPSLGNLRDMVAKQSAGGPASARASGSIAAARELSNSVAGGRKSHSCDPTPRAPSVSFREPVAPSNGLLSKLYQGDQTHRLRDYRSDCDVARAQDEHATPAPLTSGPSRASRLSFDGESPTALPDLPPADDASCVNELPVHTPCPSRSEVASGRHASVQASFHLDRAAVEAATKDLLRFQNTDEMEMRSETASREVTSLLALFESSGLASRPPKTTCLRRAEGRSEDESQMNRAGPGETQGDTASSTEISTSVAVLNFYRWLCGLPAVRLNSARLSICNVVSVALLGRASPMAQLTGEGLDFIEQLTKMVGSSGGRVSVLHGEASLIASIEQSFSSTHTIARDSTKPLIDVPQHAAAIAEHVEIVNPDALTPIACEKERRKAKTKLRITAKASSYDHEARPILAPSELPSPLQSLKLLWELQAHLPKEGKHLATLQKAAPRSKSKRVKTQSARGATSALDAIWGDRHGALAFRRRLLNPSLLEFGVARRHDTCILWTGADRELEANQVATHRSSTHRKISSTRLGGEEHRQTSSEAAVKRQSSRSVRSSCSRASGNSAPVSIPAATLLGAVCWPPAGIVPLRLVSNRRSAWTIMPDGTRFQPTESTRVAAWRVIIDRPAGGVWTAERVSEVPIKGFAIDCSSCGEPFCAVFWPDFGQAVEGFQLEVELSGLRGARTSLSFFYEFHNFVVSAIDEHLCAEAATFRCVVADSCFWGPPRQEEPTQADAPQPMKKAQLAPRVEKQAQINLVSYQSTSYTTSCVDVTIVLHSEEVASIRGELHLVRFSGEEEEVPFATVVQKLPASKHFLVRAKLPMSRQRFEVRLFASTFQEPDVYKRHPLKYEVTTTKDCQSLLSTLEDPRKKKFGYAYIDPLAQLHGIVVLAPTTRRIPVGNCYFLIYVDKAVAIEAARRSARNAKGSRSDGSPTHRNSVSDDSESGSRLYTERLQMKDVLPGARPSLCRAAQDVLAVTTGDHLLREDTPLATPATNVRRSEPATTNAVSEADRNNSSRLDSRLSKACPLTSPTISRLQENLRAVLESRTQETSEEVHIDVALRSGEVMHRLQERQDFPGFFEGFFTFGANDVEQTVQIFYRFPLVHAFEHAPHKLGDWFVVRDEQLPQNF